MVKKYISRKSEASIALGFLLVLYSKSWIECKKMLTFAAKIIINQKHKMKKFYSLFLFVVAALFGVTAQAQVEIVTSVESPITTLETLKTGSKVMFYECGEKARRGYLKEGDNQSLWISREFALGKTSSADYVWTLISVDRFEDGITVKLKSPRGNYLPNFLYQNSKPKWPGMTCLSEDSIAEYTIVSAGTADSLFYIRDENNVFFNAQGFLTGNNYGKFVGWNAEGENSLYTIHTIQTEAKTSIPTTLYLCDVDGVEIETREMNSIIGSEITAPTIANYDFVRAANYDDDTPITLPYKVESYPEEGVLNILLEYEKYPFVQIVLEDENGETLKAWDKYLQKGTHFHASDYPLNQMGYELVPGAYDDYEITEDTEIHIVYRKSNTAGLPFKPTTINGDAFAADTHYYLMSVRGGYIYHKAGEDVVKIVNSIDSDNIDAYLWAFTGNIADGITIYNKADGAGVTLFAEGSANRTQIKFGSKEDISTVEGAITLFNIAYNGDGFAFSAQNDPTACFNRLGGATAENLCFWTHANSPKDAGSRITFRELTADDINNYAFANCQVLLNTENCVGGYTTAQLANLKAAVEAKNLTAARAAATALEGEETIALDTNKSYYIVSAFKNFILNQPGKTFAVSADATDSLKWGAMDEEQMKDDHYKWELYATSDSTYVLGNVAAGRAIASFRYGKMAVLEGAAPVDSTSTDEVAVGKAAAFQLVNAPAEIAPAAFYFVHNYGASFITLAADPVNSSYVAGGKISTFNTREFGYNNAWRLKEAGSFTNGIDQNETIEPKAAAIYDLSGRRVQKVQKGIYIQNGKKIFVK